MKQSDECVLAVTIQGSETWTLTNCLEGNFGVLIGIQISLLGVILMDDISHRWMRGQRKVEDIIRARKVK